VSSIPPHSQGDLLPKKMHTRILNYIYCVIAKYVVMCRKPNKKIYYFFYPSVPPYNCSYEGKCLVRVSCSRQSRWGTVSGALSQTEAACWLASQATWLADLQLYIHIEFHAHFLGVMNILMRLST
jgi:hypothetical protein